MTPHPHSFHRRLRVAHRVLIAMCLFSAHWLFVHAASAQTAVAGTITNAATGRALEGARVTIDGTSREILTDGQGEFRFDDLSAGQVTLTASYTGLDPSSVQVAVQPGTVTRRDIGLT